MRKLLLLCFALSLALSASAVTVDNDAGCDIAALPAATLLLPYFEVDLDNFGGETTLFTVTNVTNVDQIAQVTLWTDRGYPVIAFSLYLTGYDVQSINLFDILERGIIAPDRGTGTGILPRGEFSAINPARDLSKCDRLPGTLDPVYVARMQDAFTGGFVKAFGNILPGCEGVGNPHENAVGYATIDVVGECTHLYAVDDEYWSRVIRYDNVLVGDYQQINNDQSSAQGGPLVHIRAVPEGGTPELRTRLFEYDPEFDRTFYSRFQSPETPRLDGRQPLPSQFAARWIQAGPSNFQTSLKVWREPSTGRDAACGEYANNELAVRELVVFDENENATAGGPSDVRLPATSRTSIADDDVYPQTTEVAGWMYLNLDVPGDDDATQAWVISSMRALGRFSTDTDAIALGNGCSEPVRLSEVSRPFGATIGPAPNDNRRRDDEISTKNDDTCDIAALPAATLLLPYFEVDLDDQQRDITMFTVTNVSSEEQIARVTLWTDLSYPVFSFNLYLTGYDVQSINLYDVLSRGVITTNVPATGPYSERNRDIRTGACDDSPRQLDPTLLARLQRAFLEGRTEGCAEIGNEHSNAMGYATIDLVRNCGSRGPADDDYWTEDLAHDNVLIGDFQQIQLQQNFARGGELVHIRAIPEGGQDGDTFERTFYDRHQPAARRSDGRQPLPTTFAARWINGSAHSFITRFQIWREASRGRNASCGTYDENFAPVVDMVTFDEQENAFAIEPCSRCTPPLIFDPTLPSTSNVNVNDTSVFALPTNGAVGGWMYMNLDVDAEDDDADQSWVLTTMIAQNRFSVAASATALGNGCSAPVGKSVPDGGNAVIGPAANRNSR